MNLEITIREFGEKEQDMIAITMWMAHLGRPATRTMLPMQRVTLLRLKTAIDKFLEKL